MSKSCAQNYVRTKVISLKCKDLEQDLEIERESIDNCVKLLSTFIRSLDTKVLNSIS